MAEQKKKKRQKKADKKHATKIILSTDEEIDKEDIDDTGEGAAFIWKKKMCSYSTKPSKTTNLATKMKNGHMKCLLSSLRKYSSLTTK